MIRSKKIKILSIICSLLIIICSVPAIPLGASYKKATYDDIKTDETEVLKEQIEEYEALIAENKAALEEANALQKDFSEKQEIYLTMEALYTYTLSTLEAEKTYLEVQIEETGKSIAETQSKYDATYQNFLNLVKMTYEEGNTSYLEIILGATSLSDFLSRIDRVRSMISYSDRLMDKLQGQKEELDEQYSVLSAENEQKEETIAEYEEKQAEVLAWKEENSAELASIAAEIEELESRNEYYGEKAEQLDEEFQQMVDALEAEENEKRAAAAEKARQEALAAAEKKRLAEEEAKKKAIEEAAKAQSFIWPVPVSCNHVTSQYGMRMHPVYKKYMMHYGIDIAAGYGVNIYACKDGYVSIAKYHVTYGYYVLINHQDGTSTLYAHCSKLLTTAGSYVKQGDVIAKVGATGTATGNHLHFEVRVNGTCVDPLNDVKIIKPSNLVVS